MLRPLNLSSLHPGQRLLIASTPNKSYFRVRPTLMKTFLIFLLAWYIADLASTHTILPEVRSIFGTTDNPDARKDFEQGLLLLHNFEYPDAAELFRKAQKQDPNFALAYWGEAMTYNHPIWLSQDLEEGRLAIDRYKKVALHQTRKLPDLDADLMHSLEMLYGEGSKPERDKAYSEFMASLYQKHRDNLDVAAFYALSLLGQAGGWNQELCNQAADIAGAILKEDPKHPGALHYFIHAEDHPEFARNAWDQANAYAKLASYSGHALHMPSHIYLALGKWDDVVKSNEVSWQAGVDRKESKKLTNNALNYHAHWWLAYGYLQQGRTSRAMEVLRAQLDFTRELPSPSARNHFVIMRGHYLAETNDWENAVADEAFKIQDLRIEIRTLDRFVKGLRAFRKGAQTQLGTIVADIEKDISTAEQTRKMSEGVTGCGTPSYGTGITQASILLEELKALRASMNEDQKLADEHFRKAIALEEKNGHFFGPPEILKPTHEFYGEYLLANNRVDEAIRNFEKSLQKAPGRSTSLHGLTRALELKGDTERGQKTAEILKENLKNADRSGINGFFSFP